MPPLGGAPLTDGGAAGFVGPNVAPRAMASSLDGEQDLTWGVLVGAGSLRMRLCYFQARTPGPTDLSLQSSPHPFPSRAPGSCPSLREGGVSCYQPPEVRNFETPKPFLCFLLTMTLLWISEHRPVHPQKWFGGEKEQFMFQNYVFDLTDLQARGQGLQVAETR